LSQGASTEHREVPGRDVNVDVAGLGERPEWITEKVWTGDPSYILKRFRESLCHGVGRGLR